MKNKIITIITILIFPFFVTAQEFAPIGATWYFAETYYGSLDTGLVTFSSIGDTIINNKSCQVVKKDKRSCYSFEGEYFFHQEGDSVFYFNQTSENFDLLFDFNANIGDHWNIVWGDNDFMDTMIVTVDSISWFKLNSTDSLRIQNVSITSSIFPEPSYRKIIHNIGFEISMLPFLYSSAVCDINYEMGINCYQDSNIGLFNFSGTECNYTPVHNIDKPNTFEVSPNPTSRSFFIKNRISETSKNQIQLFDFKGEMILEQSINFSKNQSVEIKTNHLSSGIYFLKISNDKYSNIQKIIVQN